MAEVTLGDNVTCDCPWVILGMDNVLTFLGDFKITVAPQSSSFTFATLPEGFRPKSDMYIQCTVQRASTSLSLYTTSVAVCADGSIKTTVKLTGENDRMLFHNKLVSIADAFYNAKIGNLTTLKTSDW